MSSVTVLSGQPARDVGDAYNHGAIGTASGFVPTENLRFREEGLTFKVAEQDQKEEEVKKFLRYQYPAMRKTQVQCNGPDEPGCEPGQQASTWCMSTSLCQLIYPPSLVSSWCTQMAVQCLLHAALLGLVASVVCPLHQNNLSTLEPESVGRS
eukprot:GHUV01049257.1.p1 GENE.GHUV01049257.1~~GHUV01049257.1.p1  ORF type:complete len:153 (-),score=31.64 GHUV01049257.1:325-783(-)